MPSIQFYADVEDWKSILSRLNDDEEIAYLVPDGRRRWIAKQTVESLTDGPHVLWHIRGGPLPLVWTSILGKFKSEPIADPFKGWKERQADASKAGPFFGSIPGVVTLIVRTRSCEKPGGIGQSAFGWLGDRYKSEGLPAAKETANWWRRLQRWVEQNAVSKVTRWGPIDGADADVWAFPSAHRQIASGAHRDMNPAG